MTNTRKEPTLAVSGNLTVLGGLHNIKSNHAPYFTITAEEYDSKGKVESCGCLHDAILKKFPRFADLIALHLSDIDGVPMHPEANGWYNLAGALPGNAGEKYHAGNSERHLPKPEGADRRGPWDTTDYRKPNAEECLQSFAEYMRITVAAARGIAASAQNIALASDWKAAREWFKQWVEEQKPRWKAEADACRAAHQLVVFGDPYTASDRA